jgi:hypothetical protein
MAVFANESLNPWLQAAMAVAAAWVSWYIWRFVFSPLLNPDEPRELPYFVPSRFRDQLWIMD